MRYQYFKELQTLKELMYRQQKYPQEFEYLNIQYFSATDVLNDHDRELMNSKLEDMKNLFNEKMYELYKTNQVLHHQIYLFEEIGKTGNIGIKLSEMNCEDIIQKLQIVENNPTVIWKNLQKYFGYGFFNMMIEQEFGINPDTHEQIAYSFIGQITSIRGDTMEKLQQVDEQVS